MSSLKLHELKTEKERLEGDKAKLAENLQQSSDIYRNEQL